MTQRNFQNARNQGDGPKGKSRKSASSAKLKSKAGASVYAPTKEAKAQRAKQEAKARKSQPAEAKANDPIEQQRRRERAMVSMMRDLPEYKSGVASGGYPWALRSSSSCDVDSQPCSSTAAH